MNIDQLRQVHQLRPFQPFCLYLADGRSLRVDHPECMGYTGGRTVFVGQADDSFHLLDVLMITGIEITNGKRRKRKSTKS